MIPALRLRSPRYRKPTAKELDLLLLAGCSCLLTILYHPVAERVQSLQSVSQSAGAVTSQINHTTPQSGTLYTTLPPKRDDIKDEEEEQA
jgi:hypothetical protein